MKHRSLLLAAATAAAQALSLSAALPDAVPYQGRVAVDGTNFTGTGHFKFAIYEHATAAFTPAVATATISGGSLTIVTINSGGAGYSPGATVSFTGGGGSGATATATIAGGVITAITVTNPGFGYTSPPTVLLTDPAAPAQLWDNAKGAVNTGPLTEPALYIKLPVTNGLYALGLGDTTLDNMAALPASLAPRAGLRAFVRVWFDDGSHGFHALSPDLELRSVPFAREALTAQNAVSVGGISLANLARLDSANTFTAVNGLTVTGPGPSNGTPASGSTVPVSGAGTRLEFLPGYSALRAGTVTGNQWDAANIGSCSTALGYDTTARGHFSTALGAATTASGICSTALGAATFASADASTAFGTYTIASGYNATALGSFTAAESAFETVLGRYNTDYTPSSTTTWNSADRLFVIGNGTSSDIRSDALVVLKSGATTLNGTLRVNARDGVAVSGTGPAGGEPATGSTVPLTGAGTRMEFLPGYSALRAGTVADIASTPWFDESKSWDPANIGMYSTALGYSTTANGFNSTALGSATNATGITSTALGYDTVASGDYSTASGNGTTASGLYSAASGYDTTAAGIASTASGYSTLAGADYSTALGYVTWATGIASTAFGNNTNAESYCETVIGRFDTDYAPGSKTSWVTTDRLFVVGNGTSHSARSDALIVYKSGNATLQGALTQGSDRNRKTDIVPADTAAVLAKVATLPLATWKYKDETVTHLGPMAQDFAAAFDLGADETGIASVDADGVALAAIQELAKRVVALTEQNAAKDARLAALEREQTALTARLLALESRLTK